MTILLSIAFVMRTLMKQIFEMNIKMGSRMQKQLSKVRLLKGELNSKYKLLSQERAFKMLKNDM